MPERQITETEPPDSDPHESFHFKSDFVKHPANLPVNTLPQNDAEMGWLDYAEDIDSRSLTVEHDSFQQLRSERCIPRPIESYLVLLLDLVARMSEALGEVTIVGEKEETLSLGVEPADVEQSREMRREEVEDGVTRVRVAPGGNEPSRLVQHDVEALLAVDQFAVDFDVVALRGLRAEIGANAAVNRDAASGNELVAMPARTQPRRGKDPVQAHGVV